MGKHIAKIIAVVPTAIASNAVRHFRRQNEIAPLIQHVPHVKIRKGIPIMRANRDLSSRSISLRVGSGQIVAHRCTTVTTKTSPIAIPTVPNDPKNSVGAIRQRMPVFIAASLGNAVVFRLSYGLSPFMSFSIEASENSDGMTESYAGKSDSRSPCSHSQGLPASPNPVRTARLSVLSGRGARIRL